MTITAKYQIEPARVEEMPLTIAVSMAVSEWRKLVKLMPYEWPASDLTRVVNDALRNVDMMAAQQFRYGVQS